jgi:hypothetical protein
MFDMHDRSCGTRKKRYTNICFKTNIFKFWRYKL